MDAASEALAADDRRRAALIAADHAALESVLSHRLVYTHASGKLDSKQSYLAGVRSGATIFHKIERRDAKAQAIGEDCVFIVGLQASDLTSGGERRDVRLRFLSVWAREAGQWRMAAWAATAAPSG